jgi:hypothetical protein
VAHCWHLEIGRVLVTEAAAQALHEAAVPVATLLDRHRLGDWGDLPDEAKSANDRALRIGGEVGSSYRLLTGAECLVVTDRSREATVVMTVLDMPILLDAKPQEREQKLRELAGAASLPEAEQDAKGSPRAGAPAPSTRPHPVPDPPT